MIREAIMNLIYVFLAAIFFSSMEVAIKLSGGAFNPIQLNLLRFFIGALILYPISKRELKKADYNLKKDDYIGFAITGLLCIVFAMTCYTLSVYYLDAHVAGILFCSNTFFSMILGHLFTKEKISKNVFIGIVIAFIGFLVLINPLNFKGSLFGFIVNILSAFSFSLYSLVGKKLNAHKPIKSPTITSFTFLFGCVELLILVLVSRISSVSEFFMGIGLDKFASIPIISGINKDNILILLYIAIFVTGMGFACHFFAVEKNPIAISSLVFFIKPILAPIFSLIFLKEKISTNEIIGVILIAIASSIIFMEKRNLEKRVSLEN